ncbi:hypothetical protein D9757_008487 [Collybiopsis confluens]|uniref:Acetyl-CoA synthetase-like protein n=1 Tax=Collybiopsis confluens TaxID=2823264 RepID=A0A8H5HFQ8_9AGAR|nr:hypothetical protein D9757_008487 [Collybiopsis confluens]
MNTFQAKETLPEIPDNLSIPQFFLDLEGSERLVAKDPDVRGVEPGNPWLIEDKTGRQIGLDEIKSRTFGLANTLKTRYDIGLDDVVLLFSRNNVDYPIAIWAVHRLGGIISRRRGANPDFQAGELLYQIQISKAQLIIVHPEALETAISAARSAGIPLERILVFNIGSKDTPQGFQSISDAVREGLAQPKQFSEPVIDARKKLAFLSFSSGTTGKPKAVAIPHYSVIINSIQTAVHNKVFQKYAPWHERRFRPGDVAIAVLPLYHIYGLVLSLHFILYSRMSLVIVERFNFEDMLRSISRYRISHLIASARRTTNPDVVRKYNLSSVRFIMTGAAPLTNETNEELFRIFPDAHVGQSYGMTETCSGCTLFSIEQRRGISGGSGILMPGTRARIVKPDGSFGTYDEVGELWVWSPSNALGYYNNEQATKETFIDGQVTSLWVRTGDEARIDQNLEVWVTDRIKEIMKVRGFQVAPAELEGCILSHPDVADACVVGIPDDYSGEVPLAFVVLNEAAAKRCETSKEETVNIRSSIQKHVADNKVYYKQLSGGVEFVPSIPKNPSGKLLRRLLREQAKNLVRSRPPRTRAKL